MRDVRVRLAMVGAVAALLCGLSGCSGDVNVATPAKARPVKPAVSATANPYPANGPSDTAAMVCQPEAQADVQQALGVPPVQPPQPAYANHVLTCPYVYDNGTIVLIVTDSPDAAKATDVYVRAHAAAAQPKELQGIGQAAFSVPDGSIWVHKDTKVLHVDVSAMPAAFGAPVRPRVSAALAIVAVIMSCWTGG